MAGKSEILMMLYKGPVPIGAECRVQLNPPDDLMTGFVAGKFFQIEDFSLGVGMEDSEAKPKPKTGQSEEDATKATAQASKFGKWRAETPGTSGSTRYNLDVEPVSFTRAMDQASTVLFQACCNSQTLKSGVIVSRKLTTTDGGPKAYLRLDFTDVLITELDWEEGEQVKEKYKFICRGLKMQYKPQASDGTLGAAIPGVWPKSKK